MGAENKTVWTTFRCIFTEWFITEECHCISRSVVYENELASLCPCTLTKLAFHFLSNWMGYDHGDSIPFDFEPFLSIWFKIERKTVTTIISHWMWMEIYRMFFFNLIFSTTCRTALHAVKIQNLYIIQKVRNGTCDLFIICWPNSFMLHHWSL